MKKQISGKFWWKPARPLAALVAAGALALAVAAPTAWAGDKIKLSDGTELVGTIEAIGGGRFVKVTTDDGQIKMMPADKVQSVNGDAWGAAADSGPAGGDSGGAYLGSGADKKEFDRILDRTTRVSQPVEGVTMWETFLQRDGLNDAMVKRANEELKVWKERYNDGCELVRGAWVGGDELKEMKEEANELYEKAYENERRNNNLDAERGYRQALNAYPNAFRPHYRLGYLKFHQGYGVVGGASKLRQAKMHARAALELQPQLPAVLSSMGAGLFVQEQYEEGVELMWKAVQIAETDTLVGNLLTALDICNAAGFTRANPKLREINLQAELLRGKYGGGSLVWIEDYNHGVEDMNPDDPEQQGPPGLRGNGSGFFITADGYLLTNKHVAETDDGFYYRVRLDEKDEEGNYVEYPARFVAADDEYDVALLKVELPEGTEVQFLPVLQDDYPPIQIDVLTLGYPTTGVGGLAFNLQVSRGQVTTTDPAGEDDFDIYLDIKGTQGNSGGPIVDRNGNAVGILSAYRKVFDSVITLAVGPRQIREFLADVGEAPPLTYDTDTDRGFNAQELAEEVRPKTLLVLIFAGEAGGDGDSDDADDEEEEEEEQDDGMPQRRAPQGSLR